MAKLGDYVAGRRRGLLGRVFVSKRTDPGSKKLGEEIKKQYGVDPATLRIPQGVRVELRGEASLMIESFGQMGFALVLAVLLAGVLAVTSAGTAIALHRFTGRSASGPRPGATGAPPGTATAQPRASRSGAPAPAAPTNVVATALGPYTIRVSWTEKAAGVMGFNIGNGCGTNGCSGGALNIRTGPVSGNESLLPTNTTVFPQDPAHLLLRELGMAVATFYLPRKPPNTPVGAPGSPFTVVLSSLLRRGRLSSILP